MKLKLKAGIDYTMTSIVWNLPLRSYFGIIKYKYSGTIHIIQSTICP